MLNIYSKVIYMHIILNIYHPMAIFILHMGKLKHKDDA